MANRDFSVQVVRKACEDYLKDRNDKIAVKQDAIVRKALAWRSWGVLKYIFKPTYESVQKTLDSDNFGEYRLCELNGCLEAGMVELVLILCKGRSGQNDTVSLTSREASILGKYLSE